MSEYMTPEARSRMWAMRAVAKAVKTGVLTRMPCEVCGVDGDEVLSNGQRRPFVQGHHDDYNFPLQVRWLCNPHHHQWHKYNRAVEMQPELVGVKPLQLFELGLKQLGSSLCRLRAHRRKQRELVTHTSKEAE